MPIKKGPIPAYFRLKQIIMDDIKNLRMKPGDPLPSEREYCERFGLSRMTVRQALKELEHEGVIVRERGRGSFVAIPPIEQEGIMSFTEMVKARGMIPETKVLEFKRIPAGELGDLLEIDPKEEIYKITRLRKASGVPVAVETVFIPVLLVPGIESVDLSGSLFSALSERYGIEIRKSKTSFSAILSTPELEELLMLRGIEPLLKVESLNFHTKPVFYEISYYRSDQFKITVNLSR
jgi:GntR family transcriptional regulator